MHRYLLSIRSDLFPVSACTQRYLSLTDVSSSEVTKPKNKRPPGPFGLFVNDLLSSTKKLDDIKGPSLTSAMREASAKWREMGASEKEKYKQRFNDEMIKWKATISEDELTARKEDSRRKKIRKRVAALRQILEESGAPLHIKAPSAFALYVKDKSPSLPGNMEQKIKFPLISDSWNNLTEDEKQIYADKSAKVKASLDKQLIDWQTKMRSEGRDSLVDCRKDILRFKPGLELESTFVKLSSMKFPSLTE